MESFALPALSEMGQGRHQRAAGMGFPSADASPSPVLPAAPAPSTSSSWCALLWFPLQPTRASLRCQRHSVSSAASVTAGAALTPDQHPVTRALCPPGLQAGL
ncbi:unnamed protein product [Pipistrellus nathusii]|uniref:Uncharacterized protein n=1 Tax=Pipistrellus nathusii TaxID=59473 RepID=A0ABN9ZV09_PIPNA